MMTTKHRYWRNSSIASLLLTLVLIALWAFMHLNEKQELQLVDIQQVNKNISEEYFSKQTLKDENDELRYLPTGVYIQSLQFFSATDVNVTGYIWQKYACDLVPVMPKVVMPEVISEMSNNKQTKMDTRNAQTEDECINSEVPIPPKGEVGFVLPEQVFSGNDISPTETYRILSEQGKHLTIGWYFEATLRQNFRYYLYPFDHKTVWIRMWPRPFFDNLVLIPDFIAYDSMGVDDIFGIDEKIVLGTWEAEDAYFDYAFSDYDNNFGIENYIGKSHFPELRYNFVLKRKFGNAFIVYLLPLLLVASLLFAAMLTVTNDHLIADKIGFNVSGFIGASSALFFVVMLAHIQLREQFSGSGIVYIEFFYILMYIILVVSTANTYFFTMESTMLGGLLIKNDNLLPKVLYWPTLLVCLILITLYVIVKYIIYQ